MALALQRDRERRQSEGAVADLRALFASLTEREREVMTLVTSGLMNKQVAAKIGLSEITVKIHRGSRDAENEGAIPGRSSQDGRNVGA